MKRRDILKGAAATLVLPALGGAAALVPARARAQASDQMLITNVRVFDGKGDALNLRIIMKGGVVYKDTL
jgi:anaerobic selenocysteine-containing dehydrogenase